MPKNLPRLFVLFAFFFIPLLPAAAKDAAAPQQDVWKRIEAAPKRGLLYEVKRGNYIAYVFGTIHVGKAEFYPLNMPVTRALMAAKFLAVEADISDQAAVAKDVAELGVYPASSKPEWRIPPALAQKLIPVLQKYGIPKEQAMMMRPWMLALTLSVFDAMQAGYDPRLAVDSYLLSFAQSQKKSIVEVEGLRKQFAIFTDMTTEQQNAFLEKTVEELAGGEGREQIVMLVDAWAKADAAGLEKQWHRSQASLTEADRFLSDKLFSERNLNMAARVEEYIRSGDTYFVAVGALHLVGEKNVIELLKQRGYRIKEL